MYVQEKSIRLTTMVKLNRIKRKNRFEILIVIFVLFDIRDFNSFIPRFNLFTPFSGSFLNERFRVISLAPGK